MYDARIKIVTEIYWARIQIFTEMYCKNFNWNVLSSLYLSIDPKKVCLPIDWPKKKVAIVLMLE